MSSFDLLRSHCNDADTVWLANCELDGQSILFCVGYFHKHLPKQVNVFDPERTRVWLVEIPDNLRGTPQPTIIASKARLQVVSSYLIM